MARAKRREFSNAVYAEIKKRCERQTGWACEICGMIVTSGEVDHIIAEGLVVDKSKKLTAADGQFLCWPCHQGPDGKTPKDKGAIAKAVRVEAKHIGAVKPKGAIAKPPKAEREHKPPMGGMSEIQRRIQT